MKLAFWKKNKRIEPETNPQAANSHAAAVFKYDDIGLQYSGTADTVSDTHSYWESLVDEDIAYKLDGHYVLPWEALFQIQQDPEHQGVIHLLALPLTSDLRPLIRSENGLSDPDFKIILDGWLDKNHIRLTDNVKRTGAIVTIAGKEYLLSQTTWSLLEKIKDFYRLSPKDEHINKKYWAQIRNLATKSGANLDEFLKKTIVLAPEELQLNLRKNLIDTESVVEVQPNFNDAPDNWLQAFDSYNEVQSQYTISLPEGGLAHVIIEPKVKHVLNEIKKMPNRRVSGERAHTFLHNPFAQLGDDATQVISEDSFTASKEKAEIYTYSARLEKSYDDLAHLVSVTITLHENSERSQPTKTLALVNLNQIDHFIDTYEKPVPILMWAGYTIDKNRYLDNEVAALKNDLAQIQQYDDDVQAKTVLDLTRYSDRVVGIGEAEPLNTKAIQKDSGESGWLPEHLKAESAGGLAAVTDTNADTATAAAMALEQNILQAEAGGDSEVRHPDTGAPLNIADAKQLLARLQNPHTAESASTTEASKDSERKKKSTLLIANNIDEADFTKQRAEILLFDDSNRPTAKMPSSFRNQEFALKSHQEYGIAWLQNLYQYAPNQVGGCLLADDMGLGKTLQLLSFIGEYLETAEHKKPVLVVAPVSLLENWEAEAKRFFSAKFGTILKLYGDGLKQRKIPKHAISAELKNNYGITNLLEEDWLGNADIVLTTYETMRDLEFSLGRVDWSIMVCDEAQKIKVPTAMVTKAAKAQKADFKIACTGTPVENSLVDLWCLFDFIQENLLGSLSEFNKNYRRPIEKNEDQDNRILERLRALIAPQVLRRMKYDVADLPPKHEVDDCKNINISSLQLEQYNHAYNDFKHSSEQGNRGSMLAVLHKIRMICAHPLKYQQHAPLQSSPKAEWLLSTLETIKQKEEKVIVFTELREVQVFLKSLLMQRFGLNVATINGSSNTNSKQGLTRQDTIDKFQNTRGFNVIILSTIAVGFGVNIQKANHVIHYTRSWNPAKEDQATDRAYRIGQEQAVYVYYPSIAAPNFETFEIKLDKLLSSKRKLADDMLKPSIELEKELLQSF